MELSQGGFAGNLGFIFILFKLHLELRSINLIAVCAFQIGGYTQPCPQSNKPFGGVIMPPSNPIAVISRKDMVVVMVAFTKGEQCEKAIITSGIPISVGLLAPNMSQGVNEEGGVMVDH